MFPVVSLVPLLLLSPALAKVAGPSDKSQEAGLKFLDPYVGSYQVHSIIISINDH